MPALLLGAAADEKDANAEPEQALPEEAAFEIAEGDSDPWSFHMVPLSC